ncbi:DUF4142 domain-containing protein [Streptomyces indiaensis]|uniref:DUF4142 domain-containing protein n=1 Tax=Streptomyces indiaensis TaxID=284033 RepID=A0ABN3DN18_9ACTN|nr:DUF4142 domain-containing protein [Streptomyces indiaensis]MCF1645860.1 DUF4142 domain-containing protein [Streptomyces indiaensis]
MRPRPPVKGRGIFSGTGLIVTCLTATLAALVFPIWSYWDRPGTTPNVLSAQTLQTRYGPLSALDQDFLTKVRLAGLWELPAGRQAQAKGTTPAVRTAGRHLVEGHRFLDERVRGVAARLDLALPDEPNAQQKQWLDRLDRARGAEYDREFATVLRVAHGTVFPVVAQVRASTRNSLVRELADDANTTVLDHIKVLEATGQVDFDAVARDLTAGGTPPATAPGLAAPPSSPSASPSGSPSTPSPSSSDYMLPPPAYRPPPE